MKRKMLALLILGFFAAACEPKSAANINQAREQDVLRIQADRFRAMTESDIDALESILADDLVYTHTTGRSETKAEFLESIQGTVSYRSVEPRETQVRFFGDTAVTNGAAAMHVSAGERQIIMEILFTEVYQKNAGKWQLVSWQSTRIPE